MRVVFTVSELLTLNTNCGGTISPLYTHRRLGLNDDIKSLGNITKECKRTDFWNRYRSEITRQLKKIRLYD